MKFISIFTSLLLAVSAFGGADPIVRNYITTNSAPTNAQTTRVLIGVAGLTDTNLWSGPNRFSGGLTNIGDALLAGSSTNSGLAVSNGLPTVFDAVAVIRLTSGVWGPSVNGAAALGTGLRQWAEMYSQAYYLNGTNITSLFTTTNDMAAAQTLVVTKSGSDSTGTRGRLDKPFLTIAAAKTAASAGDSIVVYPGLYNEHNLLKAGVNYYGIGFPTISNSLANADTAAYGIFDDRPVGATTNIINGFNLWFSQGTNITLDTNECTYTVGATNSLGAVVLTNAASTLRARFGTVNISGFYTVQFAFYFVNSTNTYIEFDTVSDPFAGSSLTTNNATCGLITIPTQTGAVYWELGDAYIKGRSINEMSTYALDAYGGTNTQTANLWLDVENIYSKIYAVGFGSPNWRTWVRTMEAKIIASSGTIAFEYHGSGKHYVDAQKIESKGSASPAFLVQSNNAVGGLNLWVRAEKISGAGGWIDSSAGTNFFTVQQLEQTAGSSGNDGIINRAGSTIYFDGLLATVTNGSVSSILGGTAVLSPNLVPSILTTNAGAVVVVRSNGVNTMAMGPALANGQTYVGDNTAITTGGLKATNFPAAGNFSTPSAQLLDMGGNEVTNILDLQGPIGGPLVVMQRTASLVNLVVSNNNAAASGDAQQWKAAATIVARVTAAGGVLASNVLATNTSSAHWFPSIGSTPTFLTNLPSQTTNVAMDASSTDRHAVLFMPTTANAQVTNQLYVRVTFNVARTDTNYTVGLSPLSVLTAVSGTPRLFTTNFLTTSYEIWSGNTAPGTSSIYIFSANVQE